MVQRRRAGGVLDSEKTQNRSKRIKGALGINTLPVTIMRPVIICRGACESNLEPILRVMERFADFNLKFVICKGPTQMLQQVRIPCFS